MQQDAFGATPFHFTNLPLHLASYPENFPDFLRTSPLETDLLKKLERFGQLEPLPVLQQSDKTYTVLGAYPLFAALLGRKDNEVLCRILPSMLEPNVLFPLQIMLDLPAFHSSPVRKALLLHEAQKWLPEQELLAFLPLMGVKPHPYLLQELLTLLQLPPVTLLALHEGRVSLKTAGMLAIFSADEQKKIVDLITKYQIGGSKQQQLIAMLGELHKRNGKAIQEWLDTDASVVLSENSHKQLHKLLNALHRKCSPKVMRAEEDFVAFVHELRAPEHIQVHHTTSFEDDELDLRLRFPNKQSLLAHWEIILGIAEVIAKENQRKLYDRE